MECNSTIKFDTKSENKAVLLGQAFSKEKGTHLFFSTPKQQCPFCHIKEVMQ